MRSIKTSILIVVSMMLVIALASCSGSSKNQLPIEPNIQSNDSQLSLGTEDTSGRSILAVYDAMIDPIAKTFTAAPAERIADYHFPLTQLYPNVLQIVGYGWTPNFWADIKLRHPYPGSGIDGYDPRVIAILPANPGVSFNYPNLNAIGNNKALYDPDGYTKLFDNLGGSIAGNTNPFKAYFKDQPYRVWSSTGVTQETQRWNLNLAGFGGSMQYKLVVDVSTNYPNPPTPGTDNAPEPVQIDAVIGDGLTSEGGDATIEVTLFDWQGQESIGDVKVEAPDIFNGIVLLQYDCPGPNPYEYVYTGTISNDFLAPEGAYKLFVSAHDKLNDILCIYDEFTVNVIYVSYNGNLIWAKRAGGSMYEDGYAVTTLSDNSTVVTGDFYAIATFGQSEPNETTLSSSGYLDIFIARYNLDGTLAWAKQAGGSMYDYGYDITTLSDNSIMVTGNIIDSATFGQGESNETTLITNGTYDIFIARYNPDGTLIWAKHAAGISDDSSNAVTTISNNSTVVTGYFYDTSTFGEDEPNETTLTSAGKSDIFIARYNPDGTIAWAKRAGGTTIEFGRALTTLSDNSIIAAGVFRGTSTFGEGEPNETILSTAGYSDIFVARYNPDGTLVWARQAGGTREDTGIAITSFSDNSFVATGYFSSTATFGQGEPNQTILTSAGNSDIFIARYNTDGMLVWAKQAGGTTGDAGNGITSLSDNSFVATGYFSSTATFGQGEPNQTILTSAGYADGFITRYNPDGSLAWAKRVGGLEIDIGYGITTLLDNTTVVTGDFSGSSTFGAGEPKETILWSTGLYDIFVARFEP